MLQRKRSILFLNLILLLPVQGRVRSGRAHERVKSGPRGLGEERSYRSYRRLQMEEEKCAMGMSTCPPSQAPSVSPAPSWAPSPSPSAAPTVSFMPTASAIPSAFPTDSPAPSGAPSSAPTSQPSSQPSSTPSSSPSSEPSSGPTISAAPTGEPSSSPSLEPSSYPTPSPSREPSAPPSLAPSGVPSSPPTSAPSDQPSGQPSISFSPTISSPPTIAPTLSANPTISTAPSAAPTMKPSSSPTQSPAPSFAPSFPPSPSPTQDPFGFDTTVISSDDSEGASYLSTCRSSIPDEAVNKKNQLLEFGYTLTLRENADVDFEVSGIELRLQRELAKEFLVCDFSQPREFHTYEIESLPVDQAMANETCASEEEPCYFVTAGFTATIFYLNDEMDGRRLQADAISDPIVAATFSSFLESAFASGDLTSTRVVDMQYQSLLNTLPPTMAPTLAPGDRSASSPTPGAITGYAVAGGAAIILLVAGLLWVRSRQDNDEEKDVSTRYAPNVQADIPEEDDDDQEEERMLGDPVDPAPSDEEFDVGSTNMTSSQYLDDGTDDQGFPRSASLEEPKVAYIMGEDENSFGSSFVPPVDQNAGMVEISDPVFVSTSSPARTRASATSSHSSDAVNFDPTMIGRDYDVKDTVEL